MGLYERVKWALQRGVRASSNIVAARVEVSLLDLPIVRLV